MSTSKPTVIELAHLSNLVYGSGGTVKVTVAKPPLAPTSTPEQEWTLETSRSYPGGFAAAVYKRADGTRALAFRGTDDSADLLRDDLAIGFGGVPPQFEHALGVAREVGLSASDFVTGHSLGGALALLVSAARNHPAVTFNAPGVADSCAMVATNEIGARFLGMLSRCGGTRRVLNVRIGGDPVSSWYTTGDQVGANDLSVTLPDVSGCSARSAAKAAKYGTQAMRFGPKAGAAFGVVSFLGLNAYCRHQMATVLAAVGQDPQYYRPLEL